MGKAGPSGAASAAPILTGNESTVHTRAVLTCKLREVTTSFGPAQSRRELQQRSSRRHHNELTPSDVEGQRDDGQEQERTREVQPRLAHRREEEEGERCRSVGPADRGWEREDEDGAAEEEQPRV